MVLSCSLCQITTSRWLNPFERCALSYRTRLMAADPFLFPMYYLLFKTVSDKWGHLHPIRTESAIHVFLSFIPPPLIFMMDTGIFLLNIIFIRYWVCCQNPQVINILRVYIPTLPEAVCSHHSSPTFLSSECCSLCSAGCSTVPVACVHLAHVCPGCFPTYHVPTSSTSRLSPSLLLGFAALCVMVSHCSHAQGFYSESTPDCSLEWWNPCCCQGGNSWFVLVPGKQPFSPQEPGHCFSDPFCCTVTVRTVAGPWWQLSTDIIRAHYLGFFLWSIHSASFKRQTRRTLLPRSEGKSSGIIFLPNAFPRRPHASAAPGPRADRSTSPPLWFVLSDVETCLAFMKPTPVMLAHWAVLTPGIHSSHFLLGQRVCEQWQHHYAMQTKCWAHWCHVWWRSYV